MEFFDQKKDVLDVKLTSYGRHLLSKGRLKPVYYAFFDDDIIYDSSFFYKKNLEGQNEIEDRIFNQSIRVKQQTNYSGVETNIKKQIKMVKSLATSSTSGNDLLSGTVRGPMDISMQHELERDYTLGMPLGKTSITNDLPPSFRFMLLAGSISSTSETFEDPNIGGAIRIPQINMDINYNITAHFLENESREHLKRQAELKNKHVVFSEVFEDGSYLKIEGNHILAMLEELNVDVEIDSFEIEVLEEVVEVKRVTEKDHFGNTVTSKQKSTSFVPMFFDPGSMETFNVSIDGNVETHMENILTPSSGSINAIFDIRSDQELSVPVALLKSSVLSPQEISSSLQNNDSLFLSKPLLAVPISDLPNSDVFGPLYDLEEDIYFTGETGGDPEECE